MMTVISDMYHFDVRVAHFSRLELGCADRFGNKASARGGVISPHVIEKLAAELKEFWQYLNTRETVL